ncbi:hypothetical protein [Shewanella surugensis]|uniref:LysM domain-containing protein n=1 Tax=Shewanella surugensis TaxID=212020 RepID=A0ABT0LDZ5_9GAMM|nr:hypothetical protein [Shewanella surugensis]MCL1125921.1 hypothetical protein [Shewanella surugensis]
MVNIIKKVIITSSLAMSSYALADVSHVSINQTLFVLGEAADFRINVVAGDIDDLRFFIQDGENKERLSVNELNTFMIHVAGDIPVLSSEAELVVHEYHDGDWQNRQRFSIFQKPNKSKTPKKRIALDNKTAQESSLKVELDDNAGHFSIDSVESQNVGMDTAEANNAIHSNLDKAFGGGMTAASASGVSGAEELNATELLSHTDAIDSQTISTRGMMSNGEGMITELAEQPSISQLDSLDSVNNIDINKSVLQPSGLQNENLTELAVEATDIKETNVSEIQLMESNPTQPQPLTKEGVPEELATSSELVLLEPIQETANVDGMNNIDVDAHPEETLASVSSENGNMTQEMKETIGSNRVAIEETDEINQSFNSVDTQNSDLTATESTTAQQQICPILVAQDETLWKIDLRYHAQWEVGLFGGALALFDANPRAFNKGSIHGLKAGARLMCPSIAILAKYQDESLAEKTFLAM